MTWLQRGPINVGGCMFGIAVDPTADDGLFAVSAGGGCWRLQYDLLKLPEISFGGGPLGWDWSSLKEQYFALPHWVPLSDTQPLLYMTAIALCERRPATVYCATGHYSRSWPAQLWRSDDQGANWRLPGGHNFELVYRLAVDPDDADRLYVAAYTGLWSTSDGGLTWTQLSPGEATDVVIDSDNASIVFAGIKGTGVIRTANARPSLAGAPFGGLTSMAPLWTTVLPWSRASAPSGTTIRIGLGGLGDPTSRTVAVKLDQEVFVNRRGGTGGSLAWASQGRRGGAGQGDWDHVIAVDPFNDDVILAGAQDLFRTADGGGSWTQVAGYSSATHSDQQHVTFDRRQRGVAYLANDGGIWGSRDGGATWPLDLNWGLVTAELFHTGISGGPAMADMYHQGLVGTTKLGSSVWGIYEGGSWEFTNVYGDPKRPGRFFVFSGKLGLRRLITVSVPVIEAAEGWPPTYGFRWEEREAGDFNTNVGDFTPTSIDFDLRPTSDTIVVGTADGRVMRSLKGDSATPTWTAELGVSTSGAVVGLAFAPSRPGFVWAVSGDGQLFSKDDINDTGNWKTRGAAATDGVIGLAVCICDHERLYLLRDDGVEMTPDGGITWTPIKGTGTAALPPLGLRSVFAHPKDATTLIVGAAGGIFLSTDDGKTWGRFDVGLPNADVGQVFMVENVLFASTVGRGLWRRSVIG